MRLNPAPGPDAQPLDIGRPAERPSPIRPPAHPGDGPVAPSRPKSPPARPIDGHDLLSALPDGRLSVGIMRMELSALLIELEAAPSPTREDRAASWALRGEVRKLSALDEYVNGLTRG
ncbi:MAG: hypothetical protein AAF366_04050 [Pseudomonadota bacterium]